MKTSSFTPKKWIDLHQYVVSQGSPEWDERAIRQVMWRCDQEAYAKFGYSLSGATWYKTEYGVDAREVAAV